MTISEQDLRDQLSAALDEYSPGPAPYTALVREGRKITMRRRLPVAAGLAVLAATAAVIPVLAGHPGPSATVRYRVTVSAPLPGSAKGLIASGTVNGTRWQVTGQVQGTGQNMAATFEYGKPSDTGTSGGFINVLDVRVASFISDAGPSAPDYIGVAGVTPGITRLIAVLSNGQHLTLVPQTIGGPHAPRVVALAMPASSDLTELIAYTARGELARAYPYTAGGHVQLGLWLQPGQPVPPGPATYLLSHGQADGRPWTVRLYQGPWGTCYASSTNVSPPECLSLTPVEQAGGQAAGRYLITVLPGPTANTELEVGLAQPQVRQIRITLPGGHTITLHPAATDGSRLFVFPTHWTPRPQWIHWTAYGTASQRLGSGQWLV